MADLRPLYFLSDAYLKSSAHVVSQAVQTWLSDWCFNQHSSIEVIDTKVIQPFDQDHIFFEKMIGYSIDQMSIMLPTSQMQRCKDLVFEDISNQHMTGTITDYLIHQAIYGLFNQIISLTKHQDQKFQQFTGCIDQMIHPMICITVRINQHSIDLWMSKYLLLPRIEYSLITRQDAVQAALVDLSACIQVNHVSILELQNLSVGDVIQTQQSIKTPIQVLLNQSVICHGHLAKRQDKLVLKLHRSSPRDQESTSDVRNGQ